MTTSTRRRRSRRPQQVRLLAGLASALVAAAAALAGVGAADATGAAAPAGTTTDDHHPASMGLVFDDEFDGPALDRSRWCTRYQYGGGAALQQGYADAACTAGGGGTLDFLNDEQQRYRDVNAKGTPLHVVHDGTLSLTATRTGSGYAAYESSMIRSKQEFRPDGSTGYYLTSRVRLPDVRGSWPAFWLAPGVRDGSSQWPPELDIFEGELNASGDANTMLHLAAHGAKQSGATTYAADSFRDDYYRSPTSLRGRWLEVGLSWTATNACWFVDGVRVHCQDYRWIGDSGAPANPSPILLNLAVGGGWAGRDGIDDAAFPLTFDIDHVRVYSSAAPAASGTTSTTTSTAAAPSTSTPSTSTSSASATTTPPTGTSSTVRPPATGTWLLRSRASGLCLTPGSAPGRPATIQPCADQRWTITSGGELRSGTRCLDATGRRTANGTPVTLWRCTGAGNQKWLARADGQLVGAASGRCLDVEGQHTAAGTTLQLWDCKGQANQRWTRVAPGAVG